MATKDFRNRLRELDQEHPQEVDNPRLSDVTEVFNEFSDDRHNQKKSYRKEKKPKRRLGKKISEVKELKRAKLDLQREEDRANMSSEDFYMKYENRELATKITSILIIVGIIGVVIFKLLSK